MKKTIGVLVVGMCFAVSSVAFAAVEKKVGTCTAIAVKMTSGSVSDKEYAVWKGACKSMTATDYK